MLPALGGPPRHGAGPHAPEQSSQVSHDAQFGPEREHLQMETDLRISEDTCLSTVKQLLSLPQGHFFSAILGKL